MICCTLLAGLFALALAMLEPWRRKTQSPLAWRPGSEPTAARRFSLTARLRSFAYAFSGFGYLIRNEHNARIHLAIAAVVVLAGLWFRISLADRVKIAVGELWPADDGRRALVFRADGFPPSPGARNGRSFVCAEARGHTNHQPLAAAIRPGTPATVMALRML